MKEKPFNFFVVEYKIIKYFKFLSTQETFGTKKALNEITDEFLAIGRQVAVKQLSQFPSILVTRVPHLSLRLHLQRPSIKHGRHTATDVPKATN